MGLYKGDRNCQMDKHGAGTWEEGGGRFEREASTWALKLAGGEQEMRQDQGEAGPRGSGCHTQRLGLCVSWGSCWGFQAGSAPTI